MGKSNKSKGDTPKVANAPKVPPSAPTNVNPPSNTAPTDPGVTKPKKKKTRACPPFPYRVRKDIYTRGKVTYGAKQKNQPALKHVTPSRFYTDNPVPRAPLLTKIGKFATCQLHTRTAEQEVRAKIAKTFEGASEKDRQRMALPLFTALNANPGIVDSSNSKKKQTISTTASGRLVHAVDVYVGSLLETAKQFLDGARILKIKKLRLAFFFLLTQTGYFGPKFPEFLMPTVQIFQIYENLSAQRAKYEKKKPEYIALKKEKKEAIQASLREQIDLNKGSDLFNAASVRTLVTRSGIGGVSEEVETIMEVIGRSFVSEALDRAVEIAKGVASKNIHEQHIVLALEFMNMKCD